MSLNDNPHDCGWPEPDQDELLESINDKLSFLCAVVSIYFVVQSVFYFLGD
jgi:hypothetical protein